MFDEYTIAYKDRGSVSERGEPDAEKVMAMGNAATGAMILNGKIAGSWKRILKTEGVEVKLSSFRPVRARRGRISPNSSKSLWRLLELETNGLVLKRVPVTFLQDL